MKRLYLLLLAGLVACSEPPVEQPDPWGIKEGDILFQDLDCGPACEAIEKVTNGVDGRDFSHCGIVARFNNELRVIEAYGSVQSVSLHDFLQRSHDSGGRPKVVIGRWKKNDSLAIKSSRLAKEYLGKDYDEAFILGDDKYYCSELVYETYRRANNGRPVFPLNLMTFKDPETGETMPYWEDYYKQLGKLIPEGDSGINPGAISRSDKLEIRQVEY